MRVSGSAEVKKEETVSSAFVADLEAAVKLFVEKWQDHPEGANALAQKHEPDLVRQELRPLVFEEVRLQVDEEMRVLLQNLKVGLHRLARFQAAEVAVAGVAILQGAALLSTPCCMMQGSGRWGICTVQYSCSFLCWFLTDGWLCCAVRCCAVLC